MTRPQWTRKADPVEVRHLYEVGYNMQEIADKTGVCRQRVGQILASRKLNRLFKRVWESQYHDIRVARVRARAKVFESLRCRVNQLYADLRLGEGGVSSRLTSKAKQAVYDFRHRGKNITLSALSNLALALNCRLVVDFELLTPEEIEELGKPNGEPDKPTLPNS